jgi:hypothetical protein
MIITPSGHYFQWENLKPSTFIEVSIKVDPNKVIPWFQAGWFGVLRYGANWVQCGWMTYGGKSPFEFCEVWTNNNFTIWRLNNVAIGSTIKVGAVYTAMGQWVFWLKSQNKPWFVARVADVTLSTGQYLTPKNATFAVATEGGGVLPSPLLYTALYLY